MVESNIIELLNFSLENLNNERLDLNKAGYLTFIFDLIDFVIKACRFFIKFNNNLILLIKGSNNLMISEYFKTITT